VLLKLLYTIRRERMFTDSFYKATITLTPKADKNTGEKIWNNFPDVESIPGMEDKGE
jgi:hypothetical protein